ncbi:MAG: hypothetical protein ACLGIS_10970, partial [Actinomycetes bacterium]
WRFRQREIGKIKRSRTTRNVTIPDLATAALYCKAHNIDIRNVTWLYKHILPALRWQTRQDQMTAQRYLTEELQRAQGIEYARMTGDDQRTAQFGSYWYERLSSAEDVAFVLSEWKAAGRDDRA